MPFIADLIPHAFPFLLVDRVIERPAAQTVVVEKRVSANDPALASGSLPDTLLLDAMAQAAACVNVEPGHRGVLVQVADVEFLARVVAGDTLRLRATQVASLGPLRRFEIDAHVDATLVGKGTLTFAIEAAP
jgi:3-hydroxyacyl-[acyl-carrier-protein] dehydratase